MNCPICSETLQPDVSTTDRIMGGVMEDCVNGCRPCERCNERNAEVDSDFCGVCDLAEKLEQGEAVGR
jgi:hypothetical protein